MLYFLGELMKTLLFLKVKEEKRDLGAKVKQQSRSLALGARGDTWTKEKVMP